MMYIDLEIKSRVWIKWRVFLAVFYYPVKCFHRVIFLVYRIVFFNCLLEAFCFHDGSAISFYVVILFHVRL